MTLTSPADDAVIQDVVLDWEPLPGAQYYELQVSTDDNFSESTVIDDRTGRDKVLGTRYSPPITYDNTVTFDAETANTVARRELDCATGPGPSYHGTMLFELTGPIQELLLRLDINNRTRELGDVIEIEDDEGPTIDGEGTTHRGRITRIRIDCESDRCTLFGDILPEDA